MHVVIVGAGEVGWYLAERLEAEHDVVVIEQDADTANAIGEDLDIQVVVGNACHPSVLEQAGIARASLLAGVTQNDEVNLIASLLAKEHGVPKTVVRIQTEELRGPAGAGLLAAVGADVVIDPDADTAQEILELVHLSGADEVYPMVGGDLLVIGAVIRPGSAVAGRRLSDVGRDFEPQWQFLFGAVTRRGETTIPRGDEVLEAGDHVRVLTTREARRETLQLIGAVSRRVRRVMVLGGGLVGSRVASAMSAEGAEVVIIERDLHRGQQLAAELPRVRVIHGDITDIELLTQESVATMDVVVATSGEDTANVLACAFAAAEGSGFTIAVMHRLALLPLVGQFGIDATLSPRTASANAVLRELRGGGGSVATFLESDVEVNEFTVEPGSPADGAVVADLHVSRSVLLGAAVRPDGSVEIVRGPTRLAAGDKVVVFARATDLHKARQHFSA
ncbi:MAG TPA: Trk system potassium transporter TrkA [Acidimicrobiales bacterium]|nr:Trk system potassium transporter TrkA [Acidimicrobiales bacterium]